MKVKKMPVWWRPNSPWLSCMMCYSTRQGCKIILLLYYFDKDKFGKPYLYNMWQAGGIRQ